MIPPEIFVCALGWLTFGLIVVSVALSVVWVVLALTWRNEHGYIRDSRLYEHIPHKHDWRKTLSGRQCRRCWKVDPS